MKNFIKVSSLLFVGALMMSCANSENKTESSEAKQVSVSEGEKTFSINASNSTINWIGSKPTGKHEGTIQISQGEVLVTDGNLVGGNFTIDMNTIKNVDLTEPEDNAKLVGHLKSADFFEVEKYPTSKFVITSVEPITGSTENYNVTGNLTLKENTKSVTFPVLFSLTEEMLKVESTAFLIDRSEWDVRYGSRKFFDNLRDNYISDDISLKVTINAKVD